MCISPGFIGKLFPAIEQVYGCEVDYATLVKTYEKEDPGPGRYSPPKVTGYVERNNLTMRLVLKRLNRLTLAFSKKLENLIAAIALNFAYYNFCRIHGSLRVTPAMSAGISDHVWSLEELLEF